MEVTYHPHVRRDILEILHYYHQIQFKLADDFHAELHQTITKAVQNPNRLS